jgi:hypothetical protein
MVNEHHLSELVEGLKLAGADNLVSVVLYGSAAKEDFDGEYSDVNVLAVVRETTAGALTSIAGTIDQWMAHDYPAPLIFSRGELEQSTDIFAIEMLDIKQHHRILYGEDVFRDLSIPMDKHRIELEHELRTKLLFLRQHYLLAAHEDGKVAHLMLDSLSSFVALFRHALLALGSNPPGSKRQVMEELAQKLAFDSSPFLDLLKVREHRMKVEALDVPHTFQQYLRGIDDVIHAVDSI